MPNNINEQAVFIQSGDPTTECRPPDSYSGGQLGQKFTVIGADGLARRFQVVQCDSTMTVAPAEGYVAWWQSRSAYRVTTSASSTFGRGGAAGIFRDRLGTGLANGYAVASVGNIVCIQLKGLAPVKGVDSPTAAFTAASLIVVPSATDGKADCLAAGTAATYPALGLSAGTQDSTTKLANVELNVADDNQ